MYSNRDFEAFMVWLREYNKSADKKVKVVGVDVNIRYEKMLDVLNEGTSRKNSAQLDSVRSIFKDRTEGWRPKGNEKIPFSAQQKEYLTRALNAIKKDLVSMTIPEG